MNENVQQTVALDLNYQILIIAIDFAFIFYPISYTNWKMAKSFF